MVDRARRLSLLLAALNLAGWVLLLGSREATPWGDLEKRRPRSTAAGVVFNLNSAWGTPLFGREIGGHPSEGPLARGFLVANLPAVATAILTYHFLAMTRLRVEAASIAAGLVAIAVSVVQWLIIGRALTGFGRKAAAV